MNNKPTAKGSINVTLIDKGLLFQGKSGKYLGVVIWENRDGEDRYGNTHTIVQDVTKEQREQGIKGKIIGNLKMWDPPQQGASSPRANTQAVQDDDDSIPF